MREKYLIKLIVVFLIAGIGLGGAYILKALSRVGMNQNYEPDQPIAFSHKIHAGENKIACLYCHFGAEKSRHAGIPPANVCLNCHNKIKKDSPEVQKVIQAMEKGEPINWIKIHNLPDFVYFNHSQHVLGGVDCRSCHGPVESMSRMRQESDLTMGWCIQCHRERGITPPTDHGKLENKTLLSGKPTPTTFGGMDCAKCHY